MLKFIVRDFAMAPELRPGDQILVRPGLRIDDRLVVVRRGDDLFVRKIKQLWLNDDSFSVAAHDALVPSWRVKHDDVVGYVVASFYPDSPDQSRRDAARIGAPLALVREEPEPDVAARRLRVAPAPWNIGATARDTAFDDRPKESERRATVI